MTLRSASSPGDRCGRGRVFAMISLLLVLVTLLAACGTTSNGNTAKHGGTLTIVPGPLGDFTRNFNVFATGSVLSGTQGLVYETLLFFNREDGSVKPWLASSYQLSSDATSITFKLRPDVKWSDGRPFTSADVVFTMNLIRNHPATDYSALWTVINSVSAPDDHTVIVSLKQPEHERAGTDRIRIRVGDRVAHTGPEMLGKDICLSAQVPQDRHRWLLQAHNDRVIIGGRHTIDHSPESTVISSGMIANQIHCKDNISTREGPAIRQLNVWTQFEGDAGGMA